jgi:cell division inhibitor SulA
VSTAPFEEERSRPAETAAGLLAAISLTASAIAMVYRPVRLAPFAIVVALIAVALARDRHSKLAAAAVIGGTIGWLVGMAIAVLTSNPIY